MSKKAKIVVSKNGPYLVSGGLPLAKEIIEIGSDGEPCGWRKTESYPAKESCALCRCGRSKNQPYCDGAHTPARFDGTETANREKYNDQAEVFEGPDLVLTDVENLCMLARQCHRQGGTWDLTMASDNPGLKKIAIQEAGDCPGGRLVAWDKKTRLPIEPEFEPSISLIEDPHMGVSGPIWVKGGVPIDSSDGSTYEIRNRVTLCRCGKSRNKPFCDGAHEPYGFRDGDESLSRRKRR